MLNPLKDKAVKCYALPSEAIGPAGRGPPTFSLARPLFNLSPEEVTKGHSHVSLIQFNRHKCFNFNFKRIPLNSSRCMAFFTYLPSQTSPNVPYRRLVSLCSNLNLWDIRESVDDDSRMRLLTLKL